MSYTITTKYFGMMPNQAEGMLNGKPFYFRARHGSWTLHLTDAAIPSEDGELVASGDAHNAGWWTEDQARSFLEALLTAASDDEKPEKEQETLDAGRLRTTIDSIASLAVPRGSLFDAYRQHGWIDSDPARVLAALWEEMIFRFNTVVAGPNPISPTGENYQEWALGVYEKDGFNCAEFLCKKLLDHLNPQVEQMGDPERLTLYFRVKPEYAIVDMCGRRAARLYTQYLLTHKQPSELPYPECPAPAPLCHVEYLEAP